MNIILKLGLDNRGVNISTDPFKTLKPVEFDCNKAYLDGLHGAASPLLDAFFYTTQALQMLETWFNHTALQHPGITVRVHHGINISNGFAANINIAFGDGNGYRTSFATAPDVVGHEIGHLLLIRDTRLLTQRPTIASAGIREAFSDFFGKTLEFYIFGMLEWRHGPWLTKDGTSMRPLDAPGMQFVEDVLHHTTGHYNGGVFTRVFYRMAKFWGIRSTMEALMCAKDLIGDTEMKTYYDISCKIIEAGYHVGMKMPVEPLTTYQKVIVSSRRRPFFRVPSSKSRYILYSTDPNAVRITVSRDREGRRLLQSAGLGRIKIRGDLSKENSPVFVHFSTGVLANKLVKIFVSHED
ncbi:neutral protease-like [Physella acuta]|uniref:neutral protease-like n=1 Tax=Physella acuta TaxID=109671 RepID=UPI0027DDED68|nr:neutral protease-like [Physella acuta]